MTLIKLLIVNVRNGQHVNVKLELNGRNFRGTGSHAFVIDGFAIARTGSF